MKKFLVGIFIITACASKSYAQVDPLYAQYMMNPFLLNPAYSGITKNFNGAVSYRKQWAGFDGSPVTINANAHLSLSDNKMGVGLIVLKDKIGNSKNTEVQATYAYRIQFGKQNLSFGLQTGVISFKNDNSALNAYDPTDPAFSGNINKTKPSFGAGVILHTDSYFLGISVPRMLKAKTTVNDVNAELYSQHFYAMAAYILSINERIKLKPSTLIKGVKGSPISIDYNASVIIDGKYSAGIFSRNFKTYGLMAQAKFGEGYRFGYAFELPANNSVGTRFTTHEVTFGISMALLTAHDNHAFFNF